jgi:hypothetical protein
MRRLPLLLASALIAAAISPRAASAGVTAEGSAPGHRIEALDLKLDGAGMVTLTLRIFNDSDEQMELDCVLRANTGDCRDVSGITLIDTMNKKRHLVAHDTTGACLCTTTVVRYLPAKSSTTIFAMFAAPPAAVKTVTAVVPSFLPLNGVPVTGP